MIILLSDTPVNEVNAKIIDESINNIQYYDNIDFKDFKGEKIILLELDGDYQQQRKLDGEDIAMYLHRVDIPKTVKFIDLYLSDMNPEFTLSKIGYDISNYFRNFDLDIKVRVTTDVSYTYTLLVPPSKAGQWEVYGLKNEIPKDKVDFNSLYAQTFKKLLWHGDNLELWLSHPQRICAPLDILYGSHETRTFKL